MGASMLYTYCGRPGSVHVKEGGCMHMAKVMLEFVMEGARRIGNETKGREEVFHSCGKRKAWDRCGASYFILEGLQWACFLMLLVGVSLALAVVLGLAWR